MRFTVRRAAMLAASIALNAFFMLSPHATATLSAMRCREECDAEFSYGGLCYQQCDYQYFNQVGNPVSYDDWQGCKSECGSYYTSCLMTSELCNLPNYFCAYCYSDPYANGHPGAVHCESFVC